MKRHKEPHVWTIYFSASGRILSLLDKQECKFEVTWVVKIRKGVVKGGVLSCVHYCNGSEGVALSGVVAELDLIHVITHRLTHHGRGNSGLLKQENIGDYF